jgi:RNA polymerase sigma-70 factor (ECF subfamily)
MESDESLFERMRGGEMAAFDALYVRYERKLFGFIRGYLADAAEAEDVFHESFLTLLSGKASFVGGSFRAWIYQVARNAALNRMRSQRRGAEAKRAILVSLQEGTEAALDGIQRREAGEALANAVGKLPVALSEVYRLRAKGMSYEEIAAVLDVPLGTVKSRMHEMVNQLKKEMAPWTAE